MPTNICCTRVLIVFKAFQENPLMSSLIQRQADAILHLLGDSFWIPVILGYHAGDRHLVPVGLLQKNMLQRFFGSCLNITLVIRFNLGSAQGLDYTTFINGRHILGYSSVTYQEETYIDSSVSEKIICIQIIPISLIASLISLGKVLVAPGGNMELNQNCNSQIQ